MSTPVALRGPAERRLDANAYSHPLPTLEFEDLNRFKLGNALFNKSWVSSPSSTQASDGLGPFYSARACEGCHMHEPVELECADGTTHVLRRPTVREQVAHAPFVDMGLSNPRLPGGRGDCTALQSVCDDLADGVQPRLGDTEVPDPMLELLTFYAERLAVSSSGPTPTCCCTTWAKLAWRLTNGRGEFVAADELGLEPRTTCAFAWDNHLTRIT